MKQTNDSRLVTVSRVEASRQNTDGRRLWTKLIENELQQRKGDRAKGGDGSDAEES